MDSGSGPDASCSHCGPSGSAAFYLSQDESVTEWAMSTDQPLGGLPGEQSVHVNEVTGQVKMMSQAEANRRNRIDAWLKTLSPEQRENLEGRHPEKFVGPSKDFGGILWVEEFQLYLAAPALPASRPSSELVFKYFAHESQDYGSIQGIGVCIEDSATQEEKFVSVAFKSGASIEATVDALKALAHAVKTGDGMVSNSDVRIGREIGMATRSGYLKTGGLDESKGKPCS